MWWVTKVVLACICVTAGKNGCVRAARTIEVGTYEELQSALYSCESGKSKCYIAIELACPLIASASVATQEASQKYRRTSL